MDKEKEMTPSRSTENKIDRSKPRSVALVAFGSMAFAALATFGGFSLMSLVKTSDLKTVVHDIAVNKLAAPRSNPNVLGSSATIDQKPKVDVVSRPPDYKNATKSFTDIGWNWSVSSGQTLNVKCFGLYRSDKTGNLLLRLSGPPETSVRGLIQNFIRKQAGLKGSNYTIGTIDGINLPITATAAVEATEKWLPFQVDLVIHATKSGTLKMQAAAATADPIVIETNSHCKP
jgi:hypothetical protein